MKIAYFSDINFRGKIPRNFENMRYEFAYMCSLDAEHNNIFNVPDNKFDLSIVLLPKDESKIQNILQNKLLEKIKSISSKVYFHQESSFNFMQDYKIKTQIDLMNYIQRIDGIFCHNENDKKYFSGLFKNKDVFVASSFMIEDEIKKINSIKKDKVIIGGNFCKWYGGIDSFFVAKNFGYEIYAPSMGRKQEDENKITGLNHLPYSNWLGWMKNLSEFKYAVHLMPTYAAGTFALNCAYFGIPCIGYNYIDTQVNLFPELSVSYGDIVSANSLANKLKEDKDFYNKISENSKESYQKYFTEDKIKQRFFDNFGGNK